MWSIICFIRSKKLNMHKLLILTLFLTIISCDKKNNEKLYESDKIIIIYKEHNSIFSEKLISLQYRSKDTLLKSKKNTFKDINDLIINSLDKPTIETDYLETRKYDILIIKKDSLLTADKIYKEFEKFLKDENLIEINQKHKH
jgi:predicted RND superfamily exporter protein